MPLKRESIQKKTKKSPESRDLKIHDPKHTIYENRKIHSDSGYKSIRDRIIEDLIINNRKRKKPIKKEASAPAPQMARRSTSKNEASSSRSLRLNYSIQRKIHDEAIDDEYQQREAARNRNNSMGNQTKTTKSFNVAKKSVLPVVPLAKMKSSSRNSALNIKTEPDYIPSETDSKSSRGNTLNNQKHPSIKIKMEEENKEAAPNTKQGMKPIQLKEELQTDQIQRMQFSSNIKWIPNYGLVHTDFESNNIMISGVSRVDDFRLLINFYDMDKKDTHTRLFCPATSKYTKMSLERVNEVKKLGGCLMVLEGSRIKIYKNEKFYKELHEPARSVNSFENIILSKDEQFAYYKHYDGLQIVEVNISRDFSLKLIQTGGNTQLCNICIVGADLFILKNSGLIEIHDLASRTIKPIRCVLQNESPNFHPKIGYQSSIFQHVGGAYGAVRQYNGKERNMDIHLVDLSSHAYYCRIEKSHAEHSLMEVFTGSEGLLYCIYGDVHRMTISRVSQRGIEPASNHATTTDPIQLPSSSHLRSINLYGTVYLFEDRVRYPRVEADEEVKKKRGRGRPRSRKTSKSENSSKGRDGEKEGIAGGSRCVLI